MRFYNWSGCATIYSNILCYLIENEIYFISSCVMNNICGNNFDFHWHLYVLTCFCFGKVSNKHVVFVIFKYQIGRPRFLRYSNVIPKS